MVIWFEHVSFDYYVSIIAASIQQVVISFQLLIALNLIFIIQFFKVFIMFHVEFSFPNLLWSNLSLADVFHPFLPS